MDIIPELKKDSPKYARKKLKSIPIDIDAQVEAGIISVPAPPIPKRLTKTECQSARKILETSMHALCNQLLGGSPHELNSEESKSQKRQYLRYERAYKKLKRWLDFWEKQ